MSLKALFVLCLFVTSHSVAQDVCCILAQKNQDQVVTTSTPASVANCKKGASLVQGYAVCTGMPDPSNKCAEFSAEEKCKACGYFWNGACLTEDPVAKAKEELKKEEEKKKKAAEKSE